MIGLVHVLSFLVVDDLNDLNPVLVRQPVLLPSSVPAAGYCQSVKHAVKYCGDIRIFLEILQQLSGVCVYFQIGIERFAVGTFHTRYKDGLSVLKICSFLCRKQVSVNLSRDGGACRSLKPSGVLEYCGLPLAEIQLDE